jgi:hypothetical protein
MVMLSKLRLVDAKKKHHKQSQASFTKLSKITLKSNVCDYNFKLTKLDFVSIYIYIYIYIYIVHTYTHIHRYIDTHAFCMVYT